MLEPDRVPRFARPFVALLIVASAAWSLRSPRAGRRSATAGPGAVGVAYGWPIRTAMVVISLAYLFVPPGHPRAVR